MNISNNNNGVSNIYIKMSQCKHNNPIRQSIQKKYHEMNPS